MVKTVKKDDFYRQMFKLAIPIIIQNLLSAAVNSSDVIMLNYVGQSAISAVSLAANYSNILFMVYYGLGTGASLLCAQYFGKKNMQAIHAVEGLPFAFHLQSQHLWHWLHLPCRRGCYYYSLQIRNWSRSDLLTYGSWELLISAGE